MCNLNSRVGVPVVKDVHCEKDRGGKHMMWNCHHPGTVGRCTAFAPMRTFIRASTSSSRPSSFVHVLVRLYLDVLMHLLGFFRAFAPSFFRWFTRVLAPFPCVRWSACLFALSFVHSLANSLVRLWARSFLCAFVRSLVHSCNHSFSVYSFVRWCARAHAFLFFVPLFGRSLAWGLKAASSVFFKVIWMI